MISEDRYKTITSFTRAAILFGRLGGYLTGQLLVLYTTIDYRQLNIISFVSVSIVFVLAFFLPRPQHSNIFHIKANRIDSRNAVEVEIDKIGLSSVKDTRNTINNKIHQGFSYMWMELKLIYSNKNVLLWSCWWALASCGQLQVSNYIQNLWKVISPEKKGTIYNGAVEAFGTLISIHIYKMCADPLLPLLGVGRQLFPR